MHLSKTHLESYPVCRSQTTQILLATSITNSHKQLQPSPKNFYTSNLSGKEIALFLPQNPPTEPHRPQNPHRNKDKKNKTNFDPQNTRTHRQKPNPATTKALKNKNRPQERFSTFKTIFNFANFLNFPKFSKSRTQLLFLSFPPPYQQCNTFLLNHKHQMFSQKINFSKNQHILSYLQFVPF